MYYDRKRKRWRATVYYTDSNGKKHRKFLDKTTRKEAILAEEEGKERKEGFPDRNILFRDCASAYLKAEEMEIRSSTLVHYEKIVRLHLLPFFGDKRMSKITSIEISDWKGELMKKNYSLQYLKHCYKVLHLIFRFASKMYSIPDAPLLAVGMR